MLSSNSLCLVSGKAGDASTSATATGAGDTSGVASATTAGGGKDQKKAIEEELTGLDTELGKLRKSYRAAYGTDFSLTNRIAALPQLNTQAQQPQASTVAPLATAATTGGGSPRK
jgi:hypothetical protein